MTKYKGLNASIIRQMQRAPKGDSALIQYEDGSFDVLNSLADEPLDGSTASLLRSPARECADSLVHAAEERALKDGASTHLTKMRGKAAEMLVENLLAEDECMEPFPQPPTSVPFLTSECLHDLVILHPGEIWAWRMLIDFEMPVIA